MIGPRYRNFPTREPASLPFEILSMKKLVFMALLFVGCIVTYESLRTWPRQDDSEHPVIPDNGNADKKIIQGPSDIEPRLVSRLHELVPDYPESHARTVLTDYGNTALDVARQHGAVGLDGLRVLGTEGVELMRFQPDTFKQLANRLSGERSIRMLALLRDHLVDLARKGGLPALIDRIEALDGPAGRLGDQYPQFLPLLVVAPQEVTEALTLHPEIATECLMIVDLSQGAAGVQKMCDLIKTQAIIGGEWFAARGADGLILAHTYPEFVNHEPAIELEVFLQILRTNSPYIASFDGRDARAKALQAIAAIAEADTRLPQVPDSRSPPNDGLMRGVLLTLASEDPYTVRFVAEHGAEGIDVLKSTASQWAGSGMSVPRTLYDAYDPAIHRNAHGHAWDSLLPRDTRGAALYALQTFAPWKELRREDWHPKATEFVLLLGKTDGRFPIWAADNERLRRSGSAGYAAADDDWAIMAGRPSLHLDDWAKKGARPYEYLPLYDTCRLLYVLGSGYQPTSGEVLFATVDIAFTAWDIATFGAGTVVTEGVEATTKTLSKVALETSEQAMKRAGREIAETSVSRASRGILATATKSPRLLKALGRRAREAANAAYWIMARGANALEGAKALGITLRVGKYVAKETAINASVGQGVEQAILFATLHRNDILVQQVSEVLSTLSNYGNPQ